MVRRREFIKALGLGSIVAVGPSWGRSAYTDPAEAKSPQAPSDSDWRTVEIKNHVANATLGDADLWLPMPLADSSYQQLISTTWSGNFSSAEITRDLIYGSEAFHAEWKGGGHKELELTQRIRVRNRGGVEPSGSQDIALYLKPTAHVQLDGVVRETATKIVGTEKNPDRIAKLMYDWIVEKTVRDPKVRGCGLGDVKGILVSQNFSGKCADLSSLFVGLCRASGVPAREVFGIRVLNSQGSKSIGKEGDVSKAQHCRAEYYSSVQSGWVPVDPADIRKVILEEKLDLQNTHVGELRQKFFGFWEMNWIAYNSARDFNLESAKEPKLNYLMYPLLKFGTDVKLASGLAREIDGREPDQFKYTITSKLMNS